MSSSGGYKVFSANTTDWVLNPDSFEYIDNNLSHFIHHTDEEEIEIIEPDNTPHKLNLKEGVALFQHTNFQGREVYIYEEGEYSLKDFKSMQLKNDDVSSIHVAPGWSVELFEHHNFQGDSRVFTSDESDLRKHKWNDRASSLKVFHKKIVAPKKIQPTVWSDVYNQYKDAVVSLLCKKSDGFYVGTAFFISHDGYLVTAAHNILETSVNDRPSVILATISNLNDTGVTKCVVCDVIGVDGNGDVAVLKARSVYNQTYLHWGRSRETPIGSDACTFGDPKGQDFQSFSAGSVRDNAYVYKGSIESMAIDAQIYEGCSGSPILDVHGQVIGIICFGVSGGDGFSWGMSQYTLEYVTNKIIRENSNFMKGIFDFQWRPVNSYFLHRTNRLDQDVEGVYCLKDSSQSVLKKDDIIVKINNESIKNANLASLLWRLQPNQEVDVHYIRSGVSEVQNCRYTLQQFSPTEDTTQLGMFSHASKYLVQPKKIEIE